MRNLRVISLPLILVAGCARPPRPAAMAEADHVRKSPAAETAASLAPEAFAHAEKLRREAEDAYQHDDGAAAQILAERAVAAYQHALVLARIAYANDTANRAQTALRAAEQRLAETEGEQKRVSTQADDLELRIKVIKDAAPLVSAGPADAAREQARLASARSLGLDARLLCAAARMVGGDTPVLASAQATFDELEKKLTDKPRPAPIDLASRARAECLAALTAARRPATSTSTIGKSDQLLSELSAMGGLLPTRDDRGVVVTLRNLFTGGQLTGEARDRLSALGRVARAHAEFPVEVVVHTSETKAGNADRDRGDAVAKALVEAGADPNHLFVDAAGSAHPVLAPPLARESSRNDRIEIVFVDPGG